jgi:hypothetical protein
VVALKSPVNMMCVLSGWYHLFKNVTTSCAVNLETVSINPMGKR